jgi:hypothetical protein
MAQWPALSLRLKKKRSWKHKRMSMRKPNHRNRGTQGLSVKKQAGRRAFSYQFPPEVVGQLPPGTTVRMISLSKEEIYDLARRVEPEVTRWFVEKPSKNALEALLLMVQAIYALLQPPELPIPQKEMVELAQTLAYGYNFAPSWPYTRQELAVALTPGHPDLRPDLPDEHVLVVAEEAEKLLLLQMAEEGITLRDATQSGMLVVTMTHKMLFDESSVFGADLHEMYHIARVLVDSHTFHPDWPYRDEAKAALSDCYNF